MEKGQKKDSVAVDIESETKPATLSIVGDELFLGGKRYPLRTFLATVTLFPDNAPKFRAESSLSMSHFSSAKVATVLIEGKIFEGSCQGPPYGPGAWPGEKVTAVTEVA